VIKAAGKPLPGRVFRSSRRATGSHRSNASDHYAQLEPVLNGDHDPSCRTPEEGRARAAYLDVHGGGFYLGSAARSDTRNALLADAQGMAVVSVDYRLAPEYPWPAAPDDCETAAVWLLEEAETLLGTPQLVIGTLLVVGTLDALFEDSLGMAARLSAAGNEVDLRVFPESTHGFTSFPTAMATAALKAIESWLDGLLDEQPAPGLRSEPPASALGC
jgi:acetyl esterase/lipase